MFARKNFFMLKRFMSTSINDMKIEYLKRSFEEFNILSTDSFVNETCSSFKRSAVLVPISVRMERNKKGHYYQKSYFTRKFLNFIIFIIFFFNFNSSIQKN